MSSNSADVPGNDPAPYSVGDTGRQRSERLRQRRAAAGMAQVSGWVTKERRAYAREVIAALARGANILPPDPEQVAILKAAQADAVAARAAEAAIRAELDVARAEGKASREAGHQAVVAALEQAAAAEQAQEALAGKLRAAEAAAAQAQAETERFQQTPGIRGRMIRWLVR